MVRHIDCLVTRISLAPLGIRNFPQETSMKALLRNALAVAGMAIATQAAAQVIFYEHEGFAGRSFTTDQQIANFERYGFNDRASSVVVQRDVWEVCEDARFGGRCVVLRPGRYSSLAAMGYERSHFIGAERERRLAHR